MKFKLHDYVIDVNNRRGQIVGWHTISTRPPSATLYQVRWEGELYASENYIHGDFLELEVAEIPL